MARTLYQLMRWAPVYAVIAIFLGMMGVPGPIVIAPVFLLFAPAGAYLATRKCRQCKAPLFVMDGNGKMNVNHCNNCGAEIGFLK